MTKKSAAKKTAAPHGRTPATEKTMRNLKKVIQGKDFVTIEDLNKFLSTVTGPGSLDALGDAALSPKEEAQELAFDAMEAGNAAEARKLAKRALRLDADCVDAVSYTHLTISHSNSTSAE